jgi:hypothetical protein
MSSRARRRFKLLISISALNGNSFSNSYSQHQIRRISARIALIGCTSLPFWLSSSLAHADKITIPYADSVRAQSVELWKKCSLDSADNLPVCKIINKGEFPTTSADFILVEKRPLPKKGRIDFLLKSAPINSQIQSNLLQQNQTSIQRDQAQTEIPLSSFEERLLIGLTDFVVDRAKQEARLYLQDEFTGKFCKEDANQDVFTQTCAVLDQLKDANFSMAGASTLLRTAIREDLRSYPVTYFEQRYKNKGANDAEKTKWLHIKIAAALYRESRGSRDMSEIIGGLAKLDSKIICPQENDELCKKVLETAKNSAKKYWLLSENLRQLRKLVGQNFDDNDKVLRFALVGALNDGQWNNAKWDDAKSQEAERLFDFVSLLDKIQGYRTQIESLQKKEIPNLNAERSYRFSAAMAGINVLLAIADDKQLNAALQNTSGLAKAIIDEDYARLIIEISAIENSETKVHANKYLPLMVELASAKSSEEMQKVFELIAAPVGSYREKFKSNLTTITGLAGIAITQEQLAMSGAPSQPVSYQPFLPVGLQHTWKFNECTGVPGLFVSLVDLGAFAVSRQGGGTVSNSSNAGWGQVFSPGIYFTYNLPAQPIVVGIGASRTPQLVTTNTGDQITSNRIQAFLAIDLTLFSFR